MRNRKLCKCRVSNDLPIARFSLIEYVIFKSSYHVIISYYHLVQIAIILTSIYGPLLSLYPYYIINVTSHLGILITVEE